jgi:hypothetical protein
MHEEADSELTDLQLSLDPISSVMILTHANVYFEIVFVSFVTYSTAGKSATVRLNTCTRCGISN